MLTGIERTAEKRPVCRDGYGLGGIVSLMQLARQKKLRGGH
jgi:hypothetical protein